jgi:integrase
MSNYDYHVFRKPKKLKNGDIVHRWYYYYIDEAGKQIQKSCGAGIRKRKDAEDFIRTLQHPAQVRGFDKNDLLIKDIARYMFMPGSMHIKRRQQLKKSVSTEVLVAGQRFMGHITKTWGDRMLRTIELDEIMNFLFAVERSGSWKNQYISYLNEIYQESQFLGAKIYKPEFPSIGRVENKADIFTEAELLLFFNPANFNYDFFFLFFLTALSGGLRLGEIRALRVKQIIFELKVVIVDGFLKDDNITRTAYNKCGSPEHPKLRAVPYPDYTLGLLQKYVTAAGLAPEDYVFRYGNHPISKSMAQSNFTKALIRAGITYDKKTLKANNFWKNGHIQKKIGIIPDGRRLIPHSLRYTYITRMSRDMDAHNLLKLTGHDSAAMVDYYNRKNLEIMLQSMPNADTATRALIPAAIMKLA